MSRQINHDKPLSEVDRAYLKARGREGEIVHNDILHGNAVEMSEEEIAAAQQAEMEQAKGQRTPPLMDNSLIAQQHMQRVESELDQLATHSDMNHGGYDEDDVTFVQSLSDEELQQHLESRDLNTSGTRPEMQKRLLDSITTEEQDGDEDEDNYDDEQAWTYSALQAELKERQLNAGGSRPELIARLREDNVKRSQDQG